MNAIIKCIDLSGKFICKVPNDKYREFSFILEDLINIGFTVHVHTTGNYHRIEVYDDIGIL